MNASSFWTPKPSLLSQLTPLSYLKNLNQPLPPAKIFTPLHIHRLTTLTDPALRRGTLATISTHLTTRTQPLTPTQALQLQKGFFFALYMHDSKSSVSVQNLISLLADLTVTTPAPEVSLPLTEAFWATMAREWTGVDALRMDKYLLWVRMVVRGVLKGIVEAPDGDSAFAEQQIALLEKFPLSPRERTVPDGLRYHVLDIYVDELERAVGQDGEDGEDGQEEQVSEAMRRVVKRLLVPVETVVKEGLSKGVRARAKEVLADERVVKWRTKRVVGDGGGEQDGQDEWGGLD
jgi:ribosomal RNA-processing protein 1